MSDVQNLPVLPRPAIASADGEERYFWDTVAVQALARHGRPDGAIEAANKMLEARRKLFPVAK